MTDDSRHQIPDVLPPFGRCLYCGDQEPPLTREHIIPYGLGGRLTIRDASCKRCQKITSKIEEQCLRSMLGAWRLTTGYPSRSDAPETLPVRGGRVEDDQWVYGRTIEVPIADIPRALVLPVFQPPAILTGRVDGPVGIWAQIEDDDLNAFHAKYGLWPESTRVNPYVFMQLLAKIAHGFATAQQGYGSFRPLLIDLIEGRDQNPARLIGCDPEPEHADPQLLRLDGYRVHGVDYVGVNIQLFGFAMAPEYVVIVGEGAPKEA